MRVTFILLLLIIGQKLFSQDILTKSTFAIIDTNETQIIQAKQIYTWITKNIRYDVKAYLKGNSSNKSDLETLKKKKGICYDYAQLFNEMCKRAKIESYLVVGYCRGSELYQGGGFFRANHCWNAVHIDSSWYLADATWGSGYIIRRPTRFDQLKSKLFKTPIVNKKIEFIPFPVPDYYNPGYDFLKDTHMPLEPSWQLKDFPYSIKSFENNINDDTIQQLNYIERLNFISHMSESQQMVVEGINGKEFNSKNNLDISMGYLARATELDYHFKKVDNSKIKTVKEYLDYYEKSNQFILKHKHLTDSLFTTRMYKIRREMNLGIGLSKAIKREYKVALKNYDKKQISLNKRNFLMGKKIKVFEKQIAKLSVVYQYQLNMMKPDIIDTSNRVSNDENLNTSLAKCVSIQNEINSGIAKFYQYAATDSALYHKCINTQRRFEWLMFFFSGPLELENNIMVSQSWEELYSKYLIYRSFLNEKNRNSNLCQKEYNATISNLNLLITEYNNQIKYINRYYLYSKDSLGTILLYEERRQTLLQIYRNEKALSMAYQELSNSQQKFNEINYEVILNTHLPSARNLSLFSKFEEMLFDDQKRCYKIEKGFINQIDSYTSKSIYSINKVVEQYNIKKKKP